MAAPTIATSLEASVEARLSTLRAQAPQWKSQPYTMFRVPAYFRESNRTAYEPRTVSIGPYYHGSPSLRAMEDHKWRYLHDFLGRGPTTMSSSSLIQEMRSLEARARACYSEISTALGSDDLVLMLLLDGCFILEFFFKWHTKEPDALCDVGWGLTLVNTDLLLLENQIPFFVLEKLYDLVTGAQGGRESLLNLLLEYIGDEKPIARPSSSTGDIHSLLHLYYESFVPKRSPEAPPTCRRKKKTAAAAATRGIPRAKEMSAAGVTFVVRRSALDMYDVRFDAGRGVMEIPAVVVDDMKRPQLVNLIAFEQTQQGAAEESRVVSSYVSMMSMLIRGAEDVELLRRWDILDNLLADDDEAARFFSHLGDGVAMNYDIQVFTRLYEDVRKYCGSWRHRNRATLMRDYFGSPWSAIAVIGVTVGIVLTAVQTYFTVFPSQK